MIRFVVGGLLVALGAVGIAVGCSSSDQVGALAQGGAAAGPSGVGGAAQSGGNGQGGGCAAVETCDDGLDNDCNGEIDDGCACEPGTREDCYDGPMGNAGVGACAMGERFCDNKGEFPTWGPCLGSILPNAELCDVPMADEDCDGSANEGCECNGVDPVACGNDVGECVAGVQQCLNGQLGTCVGSVGPSPEACNNLDDDCDAQTDESLTQPCGSNVGECSPGTTTCSMGQWGACMGQTPPVTETCNNLDDDCDGQTDEGITQVCGSNVGICKQGTQTCSMGQWGACVGGVLPGTEVCNTLDDDCDGQTDEGCNCVNGTTQSCGTDVGVCDFGIQTCVNGNWGPCTGGVLPSPEICNNLDDDCDGQTDEMLTQVCGSNVGECQQGLRTCVAGTWGACVGEIVPSPETCNNKDDDCDSLTDESLTQQCGVSNVGICKFGTSTCSMGMWGACVGAVYPVTEICGNNLDDDCDGSVDEVAECPDLPPTCTCPPSTINSAPLTTETLSASCIDPDGGTVTYLWVVTSAPPGSTSQPNPPNSSSTSFFVDLAGTYIIQLQATDDENNTVVGCSVTINSIPPQDLHVELVWNTPWGDADLHLIQANVTPTGNWFKIEPDCFFGNTTGAWPPNGPAGNATLDIDDTDGYGPENINIATSPEAGVYNIGVAYFCSHSLQKPGKPMINPGDGPAVATVNVYCGGNLISTYSNINLDKTGRFVHLATVTWPGCAGASVNNNTWTALVQPPGSALHCQVPCTQNSQCTPGEYCHSIGYCVLQ